ncbi:MAG: hypothetical protein ABI193_05045 [Minicystis sp.]
MLRQRVVSGVEVEWTLVSGKSPCSICGGAHGCRRGFDGEFACCKQVSSEWPLTSGGWVHRVEPRIEPTGTLDSTAPRKRESVDEVRGIGSSR